MSGSSGNEMFEEGSVNSVFSWAVTRTGSLMWGSVPSYEDL